MATIKNNKCNVIGRAQCKFKTSLLITGDWISSMNVLTFSYTFLPQAANLGLLSDHQFTTKKDLFHSIIAKFKRDFDRSNIPWNMKSKSSYSKVK